MADLEGAIDTLIVPGGMTVARRRSRTATARRTHRRCRPQPAGRVGVRRSVPAGQGRHARRPARHDTLAVRRRTGQPPPDAHVERDPIFVVDGHVMTSAGVTAGIDLALAMVESDLGATIARQVARYLVVFMQRPGGQAQFCVRLRTEPAGKSSFHELLDMIVANPAGDYRLPALSARVGYAERHVTRVFAKELGTTPARLRRAGAGGGSSRSCSRRPTSRSTRSPAKPGSARATRCADRSAREAGITPDEHRQRFRTTGVANATRPDTQCHRVVPGTLGHVTGSWSGLVSWRVGERPGEGVIGDLLPTFLSRQQVRAAGELDDLGHRVGLVVLGVRALDRRRHQVVLLTGDEQQRGPLVVAVVDPRRLGGRA